MAENPIKHEDIIQPGNPFDDAIKGLVILQKEIKKTAKGLLTFAKKQDATSKKGQENLRKTAKDTQKLSEAEKQALALKKSLEKQQAKTIFLRSKEGQAILKATEALKREERELKKVAKAQDTGAKSTNTWAKATGSFAAKFNTLGNVAANAISKMVSGIKGAINKFISLEKIIRSNQITSDKYDQTMAKLKGRFDALNRAIAMGDFKGVADRMRNAADAAFDYVLALDFIGDATNALNIQNSRSKREVKELQEIYMNTANEKVDKLKAVLEAEEIINKMQERTAMIGKKRVDAYLDSAKKNLH